MGNTFKSKKKLTLFGWVGKKLCPHNTTLSSISSYYLYRFLYLFSLGILYIWNTHYHEKMLHKISQLQPIVDGLKVKYMRLQSEYMFHTKQSEVVKHAASLDIYESKTPPYKIRLKLNKEGIVIKK